MISSRRRATFASARARPEAAIDFREDLGVRLKRTILRGLSLPDHLTNPGGDSYVPSWAAPLAEVWLILVGAGVKDPEQVIAQALAGPVEALGVRAEGMLPGPRDRDALGEYIIGMAPTLLTLARERAWIERIKRVDAVDETAAKEDD